MPHSEPDSSNWRRQFIDVEPVLLVSDIRAAREYFFRSLHFYCEGFTYKGKQPTYCQMFRGAVGIGLHQLPRGTKPSRRTLPVPASYADLILWLANLGEYAEEISGDGAIVAEPMRVDKCGLKTMTLEDLDGHRIRLVEDKWRDDSWPPKTAM